MHVKRFPVHFDFTPNNAKISKTISRVVRNAHFILQLDIDYDLALSRYIFDPTQREIEITSTGQHALLMKLYDMDARIRNADDHIDFYLAQKKNSEREIMGVIRRLQEELPQAEPVASLFKIERKIKHARKSEVKRLITQAIKLRPCDFLVLSHMLMDKVKSRLSKEDLRTAIKFLDYYLQFRDMFDDVLSIDEDLINHNYNNLIYCKRNEIPLSFIMDILQEKTDDMESTYRLLPLHEQERYEELTRFWVAQIPLIFRPLAEAYYKGTNKYRQKLFYIK